MESKNNFSDQNTTLGQSNTNQSENQAGSFNIDNLTDMLGGLNIPESLKKYRSTATQAIGRMTTTQKVVGGALLLLGATYLTRKKGGLGLLSKVANLNNAGKKKNDR